MQSSRINWKLWNFELILNLTMNNSPPTRDPVSQVLRREDLEYRNKINKMEEQHSKS